MIKSAFLIVAHNHFDMLRFLIKTLDSVNHDIYIHIDRKCGDVDYASFEAITRHSRVECVRDRMDVTWGGVSMIKTTLLLLERAIRGGYDYYHLISGVDFPLLSNEALDDFLEEHKGTEFVGFADHSDLEHKLGFYHLFNDGWRRHLVCANRLNSLAIRLQRILHIRRYRDVGQFAKGCNWWSITGALAKPLVADRDKFVKTYKYCSCADEVFVQTFITQHPELGLRLYNQADEYEGCLRLIDWNRGGPYTFKTSDYPELSESNRFFARKFDSLNVTMGLMDNTQ